MMILTKLVMTKVLVSITREGLMMMMMMMMMMTRNMIVDDDKSVG